MNCEKIREQMLELMTAEGKAAPEVEAHLHSCAECATELREMRKTMSLLDEWESPEPSPFFNTRLKARIREAETAEASRHSFFSLQWLRKPVLAATAAAVLVIGGVGGYTWLQMQPAEPVQVNVSAVNDLQVLQQDQEMLSNFDALDGGEASGDSAQ